ncbi:MAG: hypothetical protein ACRDTE_21590 [Pseudonocardiaceae bacterium]
MVDLERKVAAGLHLGPVADELDAMCAALGYALTLPDATERPRGLPARCDVRAEWTTAEWLQEIRSAIWSMRVMYDKLLTAYPGLE